MKLTFIGAAREVTGSCTLIEVNGKRILVDCGLEQGPDLYENCSIPAEAGEIDAVCLTHAHVDHSGKLPFLVAGGFSGEIHSTGATEKLCRIMLLDSAHIQESEAAWRNRRAKRSGREGYTPLYTVADAEKTLKLFVTHGYEEELQLFEGVSLRFLEAGHLLGSASLYFTLTENGVTKTLLFSGDLGNTNRPLLREKAIPPKADYAVIESTYGDRLHEKLRPYAEQLAEVIRDAFSRGGSVIVPAFAVGRTQELLYLIRIIKEKELVKGYGNFPVYVDSPLAVEATHIYGPDTADYYDEEAKALVEQGINPIGFDSLRLSVTSSDSIAINGDRSRKIILSASGMCEAGRIRHHLKHNLWRPENTILFVGYQSVGTLGRKLLDGAESIQLFGEEVQVNAKIAQIDGFSSHADRDMLLDWLKGPSPETLFVNHGEEETAVAFADLAEKTYGCRAEAPMTGDVFDLMLNEFTEKAAVRRVTGKKKAAAEKARSVYEHLVAACRRLMKVIEDCRGAANSELKAFTEEIEALCNKYKR